MSFIQDYSDKFSDMLRAPDADTMQRRYDFARGYLHCGFNNGLIDTSKFAALTVTLDAAQRRWRQNNAWQDFALDARGHRW